MQVVGFWRRYGAYLIDSILLTAVFTVLSFFLSFIGLTSLAATEGESIGVLLASQILYFVIAFAILFCYYIFMHSSSWQGTIGKRVLGIKVVDEYGERISTGKSTIRFLVYTFLSPILYIGFIMVAATQNKQGLHDKIAKTYCVER